MTTIAWAKRKEAQHCQQGYRENCSAVQVTVSKRKNEIRQTNKEDKQEEETTKDVSSILETLKQNSEIQVVVKLSDDHKKKLTTKGIDFGPTKLIKSETKKFEEMHTAKLSYIVFQKMK